MTSRQKREAAERARDLILSAMAAESLTGSEVGKRRGKSRQSVSQLLRGWRRAPSLATIESVLVACGYRLYFWGIPLTANLPPIIPVPRQPMPERVYQLAAEARAANPRRGELRKRLRQSGTSPGALGSVLRHSAAGASVRLDTLIATLSACGYYLQLTAERHG